MNAHLKNKHLKNRISYPHPEEIKSLIYGTLLGDAHLEKRLHNVRLCFQLESPNMEYLMWLWDQFQKHGYCTPDRPQVKTIIGANNTVIRSFRFNTWTSSTLNYLHQEWYRGGDKIRVPLNIEEHLTPLAIACWAMDDGCKVNKGFKFSTYTFLKEDVELLSQALYNRYRIETIIHSAGAPNQWILYVLVRSMPVFVEVVRPYFVESMYYKLGL